MGPAHSPHPSCSIGCVPEDGQPQAAYPSGLGESLDLPSSGQCKAVSRQVAVWDRQQGLILPLQRSGGG